MAEHEGEQPDVALGVGLIFEVNFEVGEVDLRLAPWRGLKRYSKAGAAGGRTVRRKSVKVE
jgi:hypothetical protein